MNVEEIKSRRTTAKRTFTRHVNAFNKKLDDLCCVEVAQARFEDVKTAWLDVQNSHESFVAASGFPDDGGELDEWIMEIEQRYHTAESRKFSYVKQSLQRLEEERNKVRENLMCENDAEMKLERQKIQVAYRARETAYISFMHQIKFLDSVLNNVVSETNPIEIAIDGHKKLLDSFAKAEAAQHNVLVLINEEEAKGEINWLENLENVMSELIKKFIIYKKTVESKEDNSHRKSKIKLERMKLPNFDGQIRLYPRFKFDFTEHVMPEIENNAKAAYILRSCLHGYPKKLVSCIDNDLKKM